MPASADSLQIPDVGQGSMLCCAYKALLVSSKRLAAETLPDVVQCASVLGLQAAPSSCGLSHVDGLECQALCRQQQAAEARQMAGTGQAEQQGRAQEAQRIHKQRETVTKRAAEADRQQRKQEAAAKQKVESSCFLLLGLWGLSWPW